MENGGLHQNPPSQGFLQVSSGYLDFRQFGQSMTSGSDPVTVPPRMEIAPRPFNATLTEAMNALARIWRPLLSTALLVFVPVGLFALAVFRITGAAEVVDLVMAGPQALETLSDQALRELLTPLLWALGTTVIVQLVAAFFVYLVGHILIAADLNGETMTARQARSEALSRFGVSLGAGLLTVAAVLALILSGFAVWLVPYALVGTPNATSFVVATILFFALVAPGVWVAVSLSMLTPVVALERRGVFGSMGRSISLVQGRWWPTLGYLLVVGLLGGVAIQLIQVVAFPLAAVAGAAGSSIVVAIVGIAGQGIIVAAVGAMYTLWYLDLRSRKERVLSEDLRPGS